MKGYWKVIDPARIADGLYGTTFHDTEAEANERCLMFPGSVMEWVAE